MNAIWGKRRKSSLVDILYTLKIDSLPCVRLYVPPCKHEKHVQTFDSRRRKDPTAAHARASYAVTGVEPVRQLQPTRSRHVEQGWVRREEGVEGLSVWPTSIWAEVVDTRGRAFTAVATSVWQLPFAARERMRIVDVVCTARQQRSHFKRWAETALASLTHCVVFSIWLALVTKRPVCYCLFLSCYVFTTCATS